MKRGAENNNSFSSLKSDIYFMFTNENIMYFDVSIKLKKKKKEEMSETYTFVQTTTP